MSAKRQFLADVEFLTYHDYEALQFIVEEFQRRGRAEVPDDLESGEFLLTPGGIVVDVYYQGDPFRVIE